MAIKGRDGVEANARLTASTSAVLFLLVQPSLRPTLLSLHKASFVVWFGVIAIHVLGHIVDTTKVAPLDWMRRTRRLVAGGSLRRWTLVSSLGAGALLGWLLLGEVAQWLSSSAPQVGR